MMFVMRLALSPLRVATVVVTRDAEGQASRCRRVVHATS